MSTDRLAAYLATLGPFDWAAANCCHFIAGWLVANGQPDPMTGLRQTPTLRAARRLVDELGGIREAWTARLGREPIGAAFASVGDVVQFDLPEGGYTMGICNGRTSVCVDPGGALVWLPTLEGACAWRLAP